MGVRRRAARRGPRASSKRSSRATRSARPRRSRAGAASSAGERVPAALRERAARVLRAAGAQRSRSRGRRPAARGPRRGRPARAARRGRRRARGETARTPQRALGGARALAASPCATPDGPRARPARRAAAGTRSSAGGALEAGSARFALGSASGRRPRRSRPRSRCCSRRCSIARRPTPRRRPISPGGWRRLGIVTADASMEEPYRRLARFAPQPVTVLVLGESGSGKEAVARAVHRLSPRAVRPVRAGQRPRDPGGAARERALRPRARRVHRRRPRPARPARGGGRRHDLLRRDRRSRAAAAVQAPARAAGARDPAGRREPVAAGRRPGRVGDLARPRPGGRGGALSRGSLLPSPRRAHPAARRCASAAATRCCSRATSSSGTRASTAAGALRLTPEAARRDRRATRGPATCASCRTRWRRPRRSATADGLVAPGAAARARARARAARAPPAGDYRSRVDAHRRDLIADALDRTGGNRSRAARDLGLSRQALLYLIRELKVPEPRPGGTVEAPDGLRRAAPNLYFARDLAARHRRSRHGRPVLLAHGGRLPALARGARAARGGAGRGALRAPLGLRQDDARATARTARSWRALSAWRSTTRA